MEGDRHPLQPDGDDDAAAPPLSHSPPQDDAGTVQWYTFLRRNRKNLTDVDLALLRRIFLFFFVAKN